MQTRAYARERRHTLTRACEQVQIRPTANVEELVDKALGESVDEAVGGAPGARVDEALGELVDEALGGLGDASTRWST